MMEKYKNNETHFATRTLATLGIITLFMLYSIIFISADQQSCLGNPRILPFVFLGLPLLSTFAVLDLIVLAILKAFSWRKLLTNFGVIMFVIAILFLITR